MGRRMAATGDSAPAGGRFHGGCAPHCVVAKSAQLRFRLRRKLRPLPCSSFPHRAGRGGGPFWSCPKRECAAPGGREKGACARSGAVALRARRGSAYRCLLRFGLAFGHAIPFCEVDAAVPWRIVPRSLGVVVALNCFSFRCRWSGGRWEPVERADEGIGPYGDAEGFLSCLVQAPRPPG